MKKANVILVTVMVCFAFIVVSSIPVLAGQGQGKDKILNSISLPQTGQTVSYYPGDDGYYQKGVVWPNPRFKDNDDGTVTDNLTKLVWLKSPYCFNDFGRTWTQALDVSNNLQSGLCGLSDGSLPGDWRLPNRNELLSLIDVGEIEDPRYYNNNTLPMGHPFIGVAEGHYWTSSSTIQEASRTAWALYMFLGRMDIMMKYEGHLVWPVRSERDEHHNYGRH